METNNSMDPRLVSRGPVLSKQYPNLSRPMLSLDSFNSRQSFPDPIGIGEEPSTGAQCKIRPPLDQFFRGAELGKALMMLSGGALGSLIGLVAFHQGVLPRQVVRAPVITLLTTGFFSLLFGLPLQETCPEIAVVAVVGVGVPSVLGAFLTVVADILPPNLDPFVWVVAGLMGAWLVFLLFFVFQGKGMRARVHL